MSNHSDPVLDGIPVDASYNMLSLKGFDYARALMRMDFSVLRTYLCEFDSAKPYGRLPVCLAKEYGRHLNDYVMLRDPKNNIIEVQVKRTITKLYFKSGWFGLRDFYDLDIGAWVLLTYENPTLMLMTIYDRYDKEIEYPSHSRPIVAKLDRRLCHYGPLPYVDTAFKVLTFADIFSGYMVMPWTGFCKEYFPSVETSITVVDYLGFYWRCCLKFGAHSNITVCRIGGEWGDLCKARNLVQGQSLQICVAHMSNNRTIYLKADSRPCKHDGLINPMTTIIRKKSGQPLYCIIGTTYGDDATCVRNDIFALNTYHVEFEIETARAKMSACLAKEYGMHIDDYVMLRDQNHNMFEVKVEKKNGRLYFRDGWLELSRFYNVQFGAWIKLTYLEPNLMLMTVRNKAGVYLECPNNGHPITSRVFGPPIERNLMRFKCSAVHILSKDDITSGFLELSWSSFCRDAFVNKKTALTIVDQSRFNWKCTLEFAEVGNRLVCRLGGDWKAMCVLRRFGVGHAVKLGVCDAADDGVVYLTHVPLECTHTNYVRSPIATINCKYLYQVNHYYLQCPLKKYEC